MVCRKTEKGQEQRERERELQDQKVWAEKEWNYIGNGMDETENNCKSN